MKTITFALIGAATLGAALAQGPTPTVVGAAAPAFTLTDSEGKTRSLSDYKGKVVVLEWTNRDCPFVRKHYGSGNMQSTQKKAKEMGAVWLTIVSSAEGKQGFLTSAEANAYRKEMKVNSAATLLDPEGKVGKAYGAKTTPQIVVIDKTGKVVYNGAIDDKPSTDVADVATAKNYALAALQDTFAGKRVATPTSRPYGCSVKYRD